jgi:uncharacterized membrane protein SirB2
MSEGYFFLKLTHQCSAFVTISLFIYRGIWILRNPNKVRPLWMRVVPHGIDTLLLISALSLVYITGQYPGEQPWLNAKIGALVVYILLGLIAFRFASSQKMRLIAWLLGVLIIFYIVAVAITRSPLIV